MNILRYIYLVWVSLLFLGCQTNSTPKGNTTKNELTKIASSNEQWTGIAVSKNNRIFVNYPAWSDSITYSVAEIIDGKPQPYPSEMWNSTDGPSTFQAVQSVVCDAKNRLWVLDTNNKQFQGVSEEGPVLFVFDLNTNELLRSYNFPKENYFTDSYYNDVRVDIDTDIAFITDSGHGGIIVLDLKLGTSKRFLTGHKSVVAEVDHLICNGIKWTNTVSSDGIALSPDFKYLYFTALSSHSLYRVNTSILISENTTDKKVQDAVEKVTKIPSTDGMLFDRKGNLWLGGLENNSINVWTKDGKLIQIIKDERIRWADSFAKNLEREIFFTTSQIYLPEDKRGTYDIYKVSMSVLDDKL